MKEKESELIERLSPSLRKELLLQANGKILLESPILRENFSIKSIEKLTEKMTAVDLAPEDLVYEVLNLYKNFFIIQIYRIILYFLGR